MRSQATNSQPLNPNDMAIMVALISFANNPEMKKTSMEDQITALFKKATEGQQQANQPKSPAEMLKRAFTPQSIDLYVKADQTTSKAESPKRIEELKTFRVAVKGMAQNAEKLGKASAEDIHAIYETVNRIDTVLAKYGVYFPDSKIKSSKEAAQGLHAGKTGQAGQQRASERHGRESTEALQTKQSEQKASAANKKASEAFFERLARQLLEQQKTARKEITKQDIEATKKQIKDKCKEKNSMLMGLIESGREPASKHQAFIKESNNIK